MKLRIMGTIKSEHTSNADKRRIIDKVFLRCYDVQKKELIEPIFFASENILFMLSTGLRDKNGKFAYHLDIVEDYSGGQWLVEWHNGMFYLSSLANNSTRPVLKVKHYRIVSNLFENPELLKCH